MPPYLNLLTILLSGILLLGTSPLQKQLPPLLTFSNSRAHVKVCV